MLTGGKHGYNMRKVTKIYRSCLYTALMLVIGETGTKQKGVAMDGDATQAAIVLPKSLVVPLPWLVSMLAVGLINAGVIYQQFSELKESFKESKTELAAVKDRQSNALARLGQIETNVNNVGNRMDRLESRVLEIEAHNRK